MASHAPPTTASESDVPRRWKWTSEDLVRLGELGLLPQDAKFELMDGEVLQLMPPSPHHDFLVASIAELLTKAFDPERFHVRQEKTLRLSDHHSPLPDVMVVKGRLRDYAQRFPGPHDAVLVVEVADTTLHYDRSEKLASYSSAGVPEYWIVNLQDGALEAYRDARGPDYLVRRIYRPGDSAAPLAAPAASLPVAILLGRD